MIRKYFSIIIIIIITSLVGLSASFIVRASINDHQSNYRLAQKLWRLGDDWTERLTSPRAAWALFQDDCGQIKPGSVDGCPVR